jgi:hypothetical protein
MGNENKIRDAADAVKGIVEAVPIYQDAVQPAVKEIGTALQTVAKSIHIVLAPISGLVWGYERITAYLDTTLSERLKRVPPERLITPSPVVAVPVLQALLYTAQEEDLRELFANLLATSMDKETARKAHPAFVELIRQLTPDEARLLRYLATRDGFKNDVVYPMGFPIVSVFMHQSSDGARQPYTTTFGDLPTEAGCIHTDLFESYLDNLCRLGLLEVRDRTYLSETNEDELYKPLREKVGDLNSVFRTRGEGHADYMEEFAIFTSLGCLFRDACITPKKHS